VIRRNTVRLAHRSVQAIGAVVHAAARQIHRLWSAHCRLLRDNAGYAATVGAAAAAAFTQLSWGDVAAVIMSAAVAIWTAVRAGSRGGPPSHPAPQFTAGLEAWS
jgi:hypothetical protein